MDRPVRTTARTRRAQAGMRALDRDRGDPLVPRADHLARVDLHVGLKYLLIDGPEVDAVLQVAVAADREARPLTVKTAFHRVTDEEHRRRGAMVGAGIAGLLRAAAELGPRRDEDAIGHAVRREVRVERGDRAADVAHEALVTRELLVVRVPATECHVQDLRADT